MPTKLLDFTCDHCENPFQSTWKGRKGSKRYCTNWCVTLANRGDAPTNRSCVKCAGPFSVSQPHDPKKFCSHSCSASFHNEKNRKPPALHKRKLRRDEMIADWEGGGGGSTKTGLMSQIIRMHFRKTYGEACSVCGWNELHPTTGRSLTEIDHIDGNSSNNRKNNLRMICPNHHAMTPTFRTLNAKNGPKSRATIPRLQEP